MSHKRMGLDWSFIPYSDKKGQFSKYRDAIDNVVILMKNSSFSMTEYLNYEILEHVSCACHRAT